MTLGVTVELSQLNRERSDDMHNAFVSSVGLCGVGVETVYHGELLGVYVL